MADPTTTIAGAVVTFDAELIGPAANPISSNFVFLPIPQGTATIQISLVTLNGNGTTATFPLSASDILTGLPSPPFSINRIDNQNITVIDNNDAQTATRFNYSIHVQFGNQTFQHDPVIINEPPVPPGG